MEGIGLHTVMIAATMSNAFMVRILQLVFVPHPRGISMYWIFEITKGEPII